MERMASHGVLMETSNRIRKESEDLCEKYLKGERKIIKSSVFTPKQFSRVLDRVRHLNEPRIQRDIMPWVVPSAEVLFFLGELKFDYIGEDLSAEWIRCATMGSTKPKPDYTVGLLSTAFTEEEITRLEKLCSAYQTIPVHPGCLLSVPNLRGKDRRKRNERSRSTKHP